MRILDFPETERLLKKYKFPFVNTKLCQSKKEGFLFARKIGYPVVLKISSPDIVHKTELGLVKLNIKDKKELEKNWDDILKVLKVKKIKFRGILVQKQKKGIEIAIGMKRDAQFGPVLMFGLGGIFIELLKDISLRISPITKKEAKKMIREIKAFPILEGFRGQKPVRLKNIIDIIMKVSDLSLREDKIKEIDLNPIIINEKETKVVDARIII